MHLNFVYERNTIILENWISHLHILVLCSQADPQDDCTYLAPPEIMPDFWKRVPSNATDYNKVTHTGGTNTQTMLGNM